MTSSYSVQSPVDAEPNNETSINAHSTAGNLFIGDLPISFSEQDIIQTFSRFGEILECKIMRSDVTGRSLSYGFMKFVHVSIAKQVIKEMNGVTIGGRPIRINWGSFKSKVWEGGAEDVGIPSVEPIAPSSNAKVTSEIHVSFKSYEPIGLVNEEVLRALFSRFGTVVDVAIKKIKDVSEADFVGHSGYGFVHFPTTKKGIESSLLAAKSLQDENIDGVNYRCFISHKLRKYLIELNYEMSDIQLQAEVKIGVPTVDVNRKSIQANSKKLSTSRAPIAQGIQGRSATASPSLYHGAEPPPNDPYAPDYRRFDGPTVHYATQSAASAHYPPPAYADSDVAARGWVPRERKRDHLYRVERHRDRDPRAPAPVFSRGQAQASPPPPVYYAPDDPRGPPVARRPLPVYTVVDQYGQPVPVQRAVAREPPRDPRYSRVVSYPPAEAPAGGNYKTHTKYYEVEPAPAYTTRVAARPVHSLHYPSGTEPMYHQNAPLYEGHPPRPRSHEAHHYLPRERVAYEHPPYPTPPHYLDKHDSYPRDPQDPYNQEAQLYYDEEPLPAPLSLAPPDRRATHSAPVSLVPPSHHGHEAYPNAPVMKRSHLPLDADKPLEAVPAGAAFAPTAASASAPTPASSSSSSSASAPTPASASTSALEAMPRPTLVPREEDHHLYAQPPRSAAHPTPYPSLVHPSEAPPAAEFYVVTPESPPSGAASGADKLAQYPPLNYYVGPLSEEPRKGDGLTGGHYPLPQQYAPLTPSGGVDADLNTQHLSSEFLTTPYASPDVHYRTVPLDYDANLLSTVGGANHHFSHFGMDDKSHNHEIEHILNDIGESGEGIANEGFDELNNHGELLDSVIDQRREHSATAGSDDIISIPESTPSSSLGSGLSEQEITLAEPIPAAPGLSLPGFSNGNSSATDEQPPTPKVSYRGISDKFRKTMVSTF